MILRRLPGVFLGAVIVICSIAGCGAGENPGEETHTDTLTRRQKDSILSTLPVPGAGAVGKALDAADAARARAEQHDTIG